MAESLGCGGLTGVIVAEVLSLPTVLLALGAQVGLNRAGLTGLQDQTENLLAGPQSHWLKIGKGR